MTTTENGRTTSDSSFNWRPRSRGRDWDVAQQTIDREQLDQLTAQRVEAGNQLVANQQKVDELRSQLDDLEVQLFLVSQNHQFTKATYDAETL